MLKLQFQRREWLVFVLLNLLPFRVGPFIIFLLGVFLSLGYIWASVLLIFLSAIRAQFNYIVSVVFCMNSWRVVPLIMAVCSLLF